MSDIQPSVSTKPPAPLLRRLGLRYVSVSELTIRRRRRGAGFIFVNGDGRALRDRRIARLRGEPVPTPPEE